MTRRRVPLTAVVVCVAVFAAYACVAAHDVMFGDGLELTAAAIGNGVGHPPGYPLWIVLAHLASLVPLGSLPYRVNLTASAYHAAAAGLVYASAYVIARNHIAALCAALLLAFATPPFVVWSLQADVFSLSDLFAAAIVLFCLLWMEDARRWRLALPIAACFGLGISNHQTLILLAPLALWTAACARDGLPHRRALLLLVLQCAALLVAGFALPYAHTVLASQAMSHWAFGEARTFPELLDLIDRRMYGTFSLVSGAAEQGGSSVVRIATLVGQSAWTYALATAGVVSLALRRRYRFVVAAGLIAAGPLLLFCAIANINLDTEIARGVFSRFGLLPLTAIAPFAASAFAALFDLARDGVLRAGSRAVAMAVVLTVSGVTLLQLSLRSASDPRTLSRDIFAALPPRAILLVAAEPVELAPPYFQQVENRRPDVTVVQYGFLGVQGYRENLARAIAVPPEVAFIAEPAERRDLLVRANPERPLFVAGDRPIHAPGPLAQPLVEGVVSQMIPLRAHIEQRNHYAHETSLQSRPGYGDIDNSFWRTNGFSEEVRGFYAGGFFVTAMDALRLGDRNAARAWLARASRYSNDPLIAEELQRLRP